MPSMQKSLLSITCVPVYKDRRVDEGERGRNVKVRIDKETCVGDETCVEICPEVFEMEGDVAVAKMENIPQNFEGKVKEAATSCPVEAIIIE